jgi:hypothetical protein
MALFSTGYTNTHGEPDISPSQSSAVVSILSAGTFFGALTAAPFGDLMGRRLGLIASCLVFNVGVAMQTAATSLPLFLAGRFFAGFGVGLVSALIPLYQSETAPKWIRGVIVGSYQLAITIGLLLAAVVNNATQDIQDTSCYRIPIAGESESVLPNFTYQKLIRRKQFSLHGQQCSSRACLSYQRPLATLSNKGNMKRQLKHLVKSDDFQSIILLSLKSSAKSAPTTNTNSDSGSQHT